MDECRKTSVEKESPFRRERFTDMFTFPSYARRGWRVVSRPTQGWGYGCSGSVDRVDVTYGDLRSP